jgi:hypothetical protein
MPGRPARILAAFVNYLRLPKTFRYSRPLDRAVGRDKIRSTFSFRHMMPAGLMPTMSSAWAAAADGKSSGGDQRRRRMYPCID